LYNFLVFLFSIISAFRIESDERKMILKSVFDTWKRKVRLKKDKAESVRIKLEQREKLDNLMKVLKKYKKEQKGDVKFEEIKPKVAVHSFRNRFEAQKSTIEKLTLKLEEKDRLIDELKLGILDKDALKSLNQTKIEIREIFANCSVKVRCKLPPPPDYSEKFMISTQKAPKIVQEMEEKALERAKRRELILERKRRIEENRQRMIAEALEKKRIQDEEEKKRSLETMKERRRKELELEKIKQANRLILLEKLKKAAALHRRNLLKKSFRSLLFNYLESKNNHERSVSHYRTKLLSRAVAEWLNFVELKYCDKNALADAVFAKKILTKTLTTWREVNKKKMWCSNVQILFSGAAGERESHASRRRLLRPSPVEQHFCPLAPPRLRPDHVQRETDEDRAEPLQEVNRGGICFADL
jgi:hypothetical protein